jgi:hypothetical protein
VTYLVNCGSELLFALYLQQGLNNELFNTGSTQTSLCWTAVRGNYATIVKSMLNIDGATFYYDYGGRHVPFPWAIDINSKLTKHDEGR